MKSKGVCMMKHLISNSLNEKSVINNILSGSLNKVIMLQGVFGTGKTEFATQIARMITCTNLTEAGYCGECEACSSEIVSGINSFNSDIHLLNMEKVSYDEMKTLVNLCVEKIRSKKEVYILDEFHLVDKKAQELWLAETAKLEDCYIIMTTTDKRSISDGIISRSIQLSMKQLAPLESAQLIKEFYPNATSEIVEAIIKKIGGSPRELINMSKYYANSGLESAEIKSHLSNVNQEELVLCLESMTNRELFFETFKTVRTMNTYTVRKALQDILWDWVGATDVERKKFSYLSRYSESQVFKFLISSNEDPFLTILNMFTAVTIKKPIAQDIPSQEAQKGITQKTPEEKHVTLKRW